MLWTLCIMGKLEHVTECKIAVMSELYVIEFQIATVGELRQLILIEF